ncbi:nucleolar protein 11 isoform X2 [Nomia melanderi]|uniref:nucleolar protein 11 isoform X2 n=1 Tax=Nomia melanderi TaxID=2448451 RepID=UPI001304336D|nr:uncharacterized protein LOC116432734 isoform X2 [Nomia melanderi]
MAKLYSYYTLCPLIDQQNLLGVERDSESGCAIVTLGRNIVIRYKLQDPKQLNSWTSKDRLTSQVIYDETTCRYAAIFNERKLRLWSENETDLNQIKVKLNDQTYSKETDRARRMELKRRSEELVGYTILQTKNKAYLLTLWSHGRLYSHSLIEPNSEASFNTLIGIINNIDTKHPVVMTPLNEATVAIYGADASEEGAVLMIYNVQFKLVQDVQKLKLYTKDAKLWKIEDKLLLAANRHLAIAPYHLAPQKIATLLGSSLRFKTNDETEQDDDIIVIQESTLAEWEKNEPIIAKHSTEKSPIKLSKQISSYINEGLSDAAIQQILIPQLIESKDVRTIIWCLDSFKDLPEKLLIELLIFSLRSPDGIFLPMQNGTIDHLPQTNNSYSRNSFLDKIFNLTYSDVSLSSYLKSGLNFDEILRLLQYLVQKLTDQDTNLYDCLVQQPTDKQLYEWSSLLLESHYQHYVLSRDPEVSMLLNELNCALDDHIQLLKDMGNLRPLLKRIINGKSLKLIQKDRNKFYAIEEIKLY